MDLYYKNLEIAHLESTIKNLHKAKLNYFSLENKVIEMEKLTLVTIERSLGCL